MQKLSAFATFDVRSDLTHDAGLSLAALVWAHEPTRMGRPAPTGLGQIPAVTPESINLSKDLRGRGYRFLGPTTAYAAMQSLGIVNDHIQGCHVRTACDRDRRSMPQP